MAGGPIAPHSVYLGAGAGKIFPNFFTCATNTNGAGFDEGIGVMASLDADETAYLRFAIPPTVPTGTLKLRLLAQANATSGVAKVTVKDINTAAGVSPAAGTLNSETQVSQTWATADIYVENKVTLTSTVSGNDILVVGLLFSTSGWTLAAVSTWQAFLIWE